MKNFELAEDGVDPEVVPKYTLYTGVEMPAVGLGTFGSDHADNEMIAEAVKGALSVGYRHIDCAAVYGNEKEIGHVFQEMFSTGLIKREEMWVTSKLWNNKHAETDVIPACKQSLAELQLDYLDLYLVHWPFPNFHSPGCDVTSRSKKAESYIHENFMKTWRQMEKLVEMGLVKHIGTSNMTIPKMELLIRDAAIKPACNEMEIHPHFQQEELFKLIYAHGIVPIGYCPIGSPGRPERDRRPEDTVDIEEPVIKKISDAHGIHPAVTCLKWGVQRGEVVIPMSTKRHNYLANLKGVTEDPLTELEMEAISEIDKNCRLIKGQVFLWKDTQSWEDLWDVDGYITPA